MSGLEVGGWFVSAGLSILVGQVRSYIRHQYKARSNIKKMLMSLERDLTKIQTIIHETDKRRIENQALKDWLRDLKDAAYDTEDVLDMFEYKIIEDKVEGKSNQVSTSYRNLFKKAGSKIKSFSSSDDNIKDLNEVVDRFKKIVIDMEPLIELMHSQPIVNVKIHEKMDWRESTASKPTELFGRGNERSCVMKLLFETDSGDGVSSSKNVHILPIVGIGGVGKTTIAQDVYNDQNVKNHFDLMAWVCVSDDFNVKRLAKEIIESAKIEKPQDFYYLQNLDRIQEILKQGLTGKRFLIVLDDVWNEVATKWEKLQDVLNTGKEGSRVIVTTRSPKIVDMMGTKEAVTLGGLEDEEFWRFFVLCAFGDKNPTHHPSLVQLGKKIAKRLGGNPLAAKTMGAVLKDDFKDEYWREVLNSELWQVDQKEDGIMSVLRLSYEYLPSHLKKCFVYCSLFPKDYQISKKTLVRLWMTHGFLLNNHNIMEKLGKAYINDLLSRSFLQKRGNEYVIHDLLHDLARNLSEGEIFIADDDREVNIPERVRHISIRVSNLSLVCNNENAKKNLRSLVVFNCNEESLVMLKELKDLRVLLILGEFKGELPSESIEKMFHLRYLKIEREWYIIDDLLEDNECFHKMPKSLGKLYHLQVLDVGDCRNCSPGVLPKDIIKLVNLCHLEASTEGVAGIGTLISLQELVFHVTQRESEFEIGQLRKMSQLRRLKIKGLESVESKEQASEAMLENKEHLHHLKLKWEHDNTNLIVDDDDSKVLEGLQPHQNLKKLSIEGYAGSIPSWLNGNWLSCLKEIELIGCSKWEILPPLGQLPFLKLLYLQRMNAMRRIVTESYGIRRSNNNTSASSSSSTAVFPSLVVLYVREMLELEELNEVEEGLELFPHLSYLSVYKCPNLRGSRFLFPPSQFKDIVIRWEDVDIQVKCITDEKIEIKCYNTSILAEWIPWNTLTSTEHLSFQTYNPYCPHIIPTEWFQYLTSLRSLHFVRCNYLEFLPSNLISSLSSYCLPPYKILEITDCPNIKSLPEVGLPASLQQLRIKQCSNIKSLPEVGLPASLQELHIEYCYKLRERCRKDGPDWHQISHIPYISIDEEVVQDLRTE